MNKADQQRKGFGCTDEQWQIVRGDLSLPYGKCPVRKWVDQRRDALARGISWDLSLWDWWSVWQQSGRWAERGVKANQFCMCRYGDVGAYALVNIYIATNSQNHSDAWNSGKKRERNIRPAGCGVEILKRCRTRPFRARYGKKGLGCFETFDEAHAAYLMAREKALSKNSA